MQPQDSRDFNNKRITKNTLILYVRMLFSMLVSLYTSRVILHALGVSDFGIYNVVGGLVLMFGIASGAISVAISRFITFELGTNDQARLNTIFSSSVIIQIIISVISILLLETVGLWFLNTHLDFPLDRSHATNVAYQFAIVTFCINLINIPFYSTIIAHEKMTAFAYISVYESLAKLAMAFLISCICYDKLISYAVALCIIACSVSLFYFIYCRCNFEESRHFGAFDKSTFKAIFSYSGWTYIATSSGLLRDVGGNLLINIFCGPVANAARAIGIQVQYAVNLFVTNFMTALNPQITKNYATGNYAYMKSLIFYGSRISYYMLLFLSLPVILNTPYILLLWLGRTPQFTVEFARLALIFVMSESISNALNTAAIASGKIRNYQLLVGGLQSLNFPISFAVLYWGYPPYVIFIVAIAISQACLLPRLYVLRGMIGLSARSFLKNVYLNIIIVTFASLIGPLLLQYFLKESFLALVLSCMICFSSVAIAVYCLGCNNQDKILIKSKLNALLKRSIFERQ